MADMSKRKYIWHGAAQEEDSDLVFSIFILTDSSNYLYAEMEDLTTTDKMLLAIDGIHFTMLQDISVYANFDVPIQGKLDNTFSILLDTFTADYHDILLELLLVTRNLYEEYFIEQKVARLAKTVLGEELDRVLHNDTLNNT